MSVEYFDPDEIVLGSDSPGDIIAPNGQPWDMPAFTMEEATEIGRIAGELISSGEWGEIEERLIRIARGIR